MHYRLQAMANFRSSAGNCDKSEVTQNTGARGSMPEHFDEAISCKHSLAPSLPDRYESHAKYVVETLLLQQCLVDADLVHKHVCLVAQLC